MTQPTDLAKVHQRLSRRDAILRPIIKHVGPCTLNVDTDHFGVLARSIISQQISTKAALSISARLLTSLSGSLTPKSILKAKDEDLRGAGLSQSKMLSLQDLATKCQAGEVPLPQLIDMDDEAVIDSLIPVRGIGRWTAEMFLIFSLGRLDVLPVGDYGLRANAAKLYQLPDLPGKAQLETLAEPWRPHRSIGTWYVWRSAGVVPQST